VLARFVGLVFWIANDMSQVLIFVLLVSI